MAALVDVPNFLLGTNGASGVVSFTTGSVTVAAGDNALLFFVEAYIPVAPTIFSSVMWGATTLVNLGRIANVAPGTTAEVWAVGLPPPGSATIVATAANLLEGFASYAAVPLKNVAVFGAPSGAVNLTGSPIALILSGGSANDLYVGFGVLNTASIAPSGNMVNLGSNQAYAASCDTILGSLAGAFSWSGAGGTNTTAEAIGVAVFGTTTSIAWVRA